ncbi:PREDICTED: uncharacterized protein LOC104703932 [Camelina sativa]|uniref:Uncharacterized protein LOC104703932 n=1 Tax=Camelina sativa TaxID=90675 RepID=A0ABM0SZC9_CAMSA|nr:PREDICTED: uncharacterized protein LOC104703932 [Camelina sativa]
MANSAAKPKFSLRLIIDEEKNRVVLAEAGKDFVDVLCSLLTLPMGTIVRLLEKHQNPQPSIVGCFHNLYKSVSDMDVDNFETQTGKKFLLYPRSAKSSHCRNLKLNIDDTEVTKFFVCPNFVSTQPCSEVYINISSTRCRCCGRSMSHELHCEGEQTYSCLGDKSNGVFLSCRTSFIITDDLKVALNSMGLVLNVLNDLGYDGFDKLQEMVIDVGFEEVLTLLGCMFTSESPLTDTFLRKNCMSKKRKMFTPLVQESKVAEDADELISLKVYIRKTDRVILYAECREEFVDFLFTFLAIPLEFAWELSVDSMNMGCVGNLCRSVKDLSFEKQNEPTDSKCVLSYFYNFRVGAQLLDVVIQETPEMNAWLTVMAGTSDSASFGLLKGATNFIVSDDLVVTPMNSSSTISLLSKLQMNIGDIEEQVISVGKAEATSLLRASLITTSALTNGLSSYLSKMDPPKEETQSTSKILKSDKPKEAPKEETQATSKIQKSDKPNEAPKEETQATSKIQKSDKINEAWQLL